jgi:DNA-binding transcriptional MerR regulator
MTSKFSIKDLERLSGIKAHTIRIWEQRYHLLKPERTDTNIRYYSNEDLKLILNVSVLNNHGIKISKIASLNQEEISKEVKKIVNTALNETEQMNALIVSMIELDETKFEELITSSIEKSGFPPTVLNLIYPFLEKIGIMWQTNTINPAQEHFISNLIRQKFIVAIDQQKNKLKLVNKKVLLYLPEGELHELSLMFYNYTIRNSGNKSIYLGQSVPFEDLEKIVGISKPDYILTVVTNQLKDQSIDEYVTKVGSTFPEIKIFFSGYLIASNQLKSRKNIHISDSISQLIQTLNNL